MVSRLPVFSGKKVGKRVPPDILLPVFVGVVLIFALLIAYPWPVLAIGAILYLASLPFGWIAHRDYVRRDAEAMAQAGIPGAGLQSAEIVNAELQGRTEVGGDAAPNGPGDPPPGNQGAVLPFDRGGERPTSR
jgi:CDP-diacylglycerol--serine O-phosphatidyltransferase